MTNTLTMDTKYTNITGVSSSPFSNLYNLTAYYSLDSQTRSVRETFNPMCEVFPNVSCVLKIFIALSGAQ